MSWEHFQKSLNYQSGKSVPDLQTILQWGDDLKNGGWVYNAQLQKYRGVALPLLLKCWQILINNSTDKLVFMKADV